MKSAFVLPQGSYLLNHSVGRPLASVQHHFNEHFFAPWQQGSTEPWQQWLHSVDEFTKQLAILFNSSAELFCPQVNLSSALTKLVMAHSRLNAKPCKVLMSEHDFPSMGFALRQALPKGSEIVFIDSQLDVTDADVWQSYLSADIDLVFVSQVYSNTGQQAPVTEITKAAKKNDSLVMVDVAQGAGIIPLDLSACEPDFMIGSSVKWLCSGPGAAYLWVSQAQLSHCQPKDVGWFSHQNPFEFDIHHFAYHETALRFWGGTPSIAPYVLAAHSIGWFNEFGIKNVRAHNLALQDELIAQLGEYVVSPLEHSKRSGTVIVDLGERQQAVLDALKSKHVAVDARAHGVRVSGHIYNDSADISAFVNCVKASL